MELAIDPAHHHHNPKRKTSVRTTAVSVKAGGGHGTQPAVGAKNARRLIKRGSGDMKSSASDLADLERSKISDRSASQESILQQLGRAVTTPAAVAVGPVLGQHRQHHHHQPKNSTGRVLTITGQAGGGLAGGSGGGVVDVGDGIVLPIMVPRGQIVRTDVVTVSYDDARSSRSEGDGSLSPDDGGMVGSRGRRSSSDAARTDARLWRPMNV